MPCPLDGPTIGGAEFLNPEERNDLLKIAIVRDGFAHLLGNPVVRLADETRIEEG